MNDKTNPHKRDTNKIREGALNSYLRESLDEQDIDFVAKTYSELHSIAIDAFVCELALRINRKPKGIIVAVSPRLPTGQYRHIISEENLASKAYADIEFLAYDPSDDRTDNKTFCKHYSVRIFKYCRFALGVFNVLLRKKKSRSLFFLSVVYYDLSYLTLFSNAAISRKYTPIFVLIEEGVGTYLTYDAWRFYYKQALDMQKGASLITSIESHFLTLIRKLFNVLSHFLATQDKLLFSRINGKLIPNKNTVEQYKKVIKHRTRFTHGENQDNTRNALILTEPLSEESLCSSEFELSVVEQLVEILNRNGLHPTIKPHPTEINGKYDALRKKNHVSILKTDSPVEEIFLAINPLCVIGRASTALLTANVLYNIPAISVSDLFFSPVDDQFLLETHQFKELAEDYVHFVSNLTELENLVRGIASNSINTD